ncbi:MAG: hypothetical protein MUF00_18300 [Gemmatimonadaceae bacterium]|nr:hypothetical protein [Gemmatimonadaceae bacterium]
MATTHNPVIRACYARLVAIGTPKTPALVVYMRQRLTIMRTLVRTGTARDVTIGALSARRPC